MSGGSVLEHQVDSAGAMVHASWFPSSQPAKAWISLVGSPVTRVRCHVSRPATFSVTFARLCATMQSLLTPSCPCWPRGGGVEPATLGIGDR